MCLAGGRGEVMMVKLQFNPLQNHSESSYSTGTGIHEAVSKSWENNSIKRTILCAEEQNWPR